MQDEIETARRLADQARDPTTYSLLTYAWVLLLSILGGMVSFYRKVKKKQARWLNIAELIGECFTSAFAGLITFYLCEGAKMDPLFTAALVGIAGHMGTRALFLIEEWVKRRFPEV